MSDDLRHIMQQAQSVKGSPTDRPTRSLGLTLVFDDIERMIHEIDPVWHLNPPRPGTSLWSELTKEQRLELIPRFLRRVVASEENIEKVRNSLGVEHTGVIGGIPVVAVSWVPKDRAALVDGNGHLLCVIDLGEESK